jgi:hypothetical protein
MNSATDIKEPGSSGQHAIERWESEGGGPAGAGAPYDLAHIAQVDSAGWRASNSTGWLENRSLGGMSNDVGALAIASALADNDEEDQILRSLGAAVITRWNTIPTKLQRELFDDASSMGELLQTDLLKGQIARFLHKHKDDAR